MITCYDDPTSHFSCYQCENVQRCKNICETGVCGDFVRANGCWNCVRGCVPNFYDYGRCPWKLKEGYPSKNSYLKEE